MWGSVGGLGTVKHCLQHPPSGRCRLCGILVGAAYLRHELRDGLCEECWLRVTLYRPIAESCPSIWVGDYPVADLRRAPYGAREACEADGRPYLVEEATRMRGKRAGTMLRRIVLRAAPRELLYVWRTWALSRGYRDPSVSFQERTAVAYYVREEEDNGG